MTVFDKPFLFFDNPRGGTDQLDKAKAAGFLGGFGNVIDFPASDWDTHRAHAKAAGLFFGPWGRTGHPPPWGTGFEQAKALKIRTTAQAWGNAPYILNCEKEIDNSGDTITKFINQLTMLEDAALSCEAWPFGNVDWGPVAHLPVCPQIMPPDWGWQTKSKAEIMQRANDSKAEWHRRGIRCVYFTFASFGGMAPSQYELKAPYSLFTADAIGIANYGLWKPTSSGFVGCVEPPKPPEPPRKPVATYLAEVHALAKAAVTEHGLGPHSRLKIIERESGTEFPQDQWRVELGPEISLLLDQARGDD